MIVGVDCFTKWPFEKRLIVMRPMFLFNGSSDMANPSGTDMPEKATGLGGFHWLCLCSTRCMATHFAPTEFMGWREGGFTLFDVVLGDV